MIVDAWMFPAFVKIRAEIPHREQFWNLEVAYVPGPQGGDGWDVRLSATTDPEDPRLVAHPGIRYSRHRTPCSATAGDQDGRRVREDHTGVPD